MAYLIGFRAKKSSQADEKNIVDLVIKSYLNRTQYGEFSTTEEVDGAIDMLKKLPQTLDVQEKIADMENTKLKISAKLNDMLMDKSVFETDLREAANQVAQNNLQNPKALIGSLAAIYGDAVERYENDIYSNIFQRYGSTEKIPADVMNYRKTLEDKAKMYASVFNSYNFVDERTGEVGMLNPDAFGVVIDTNPATGKISSIDIMPSNEINNDQYMRTDTPLNMINGMPNKKLPVYLRTFDGGMSEFGKPIRSAVLGGLVYSGVNTKNKADDAGSLGVGMLQVQKDGEGFLKNIGRALVPKWFGMEENLFGRSQDDVVSSIKQNGIDLKQFSYDSADIPNGSVLRMGNRVFYSTKNDNEIFEIKGSDDGEKMNNLNKIITENGDDPNIVGMPYFIDRNYLIAPDGSSRIKATVDSNYFSPEAKAVGGSAGGGGGTNPFLSNSLKMDVASGQAEAPLQQSSFFNQPNEQSTPSSVSSKNTPTKISSAKESVAGKPSAPNIIEKGKSFFKNRIA